jgi:HEAT repeat protein
VRAAAIESALRRPDVKELLSEIRRGLADPEWIVRDAAAAAVGKLEDADMAETLRGMVAGDPRIEVKFTAALALERVADILGFEYIHRMLKSDNATERRLAVIALGKLREGTKVTTLIGMLDDPETQVRAAAALALERLAAAEAVDALAKRVTDDAEDPDTKTAAVHALAKILGTAAEPKVLPGLGDRNVLVRTHAGAAILVARAGPAVEETVESAPAME